MSDNKMNSGQADARQILLHALESVFPESAVRRHVSFDKKDADFDGGRPEVQPCRL